MCDALHYLLDNIFIRFGSKLYRQIVGISMGTNCAPLVAVLFLFCYESLLLQFCFCFVMRAHNVHKVLSLRDFMLSLSDNNHNDIIEAV